MTNADKMFMGKVIFSSIAALMTAAALVAGYGLVTTGNPGLLIVAIAFTTMATGCIAAVALAD